MSLTKPIDQLEEPRDGDELRATLLEHLGELRTRVIRSLIFLGVGWGFGYYLEPRLFSILTKPLTSQFEAHPKFQLAYHGFADAFLMQLKVGLVLGLLFALPFIVLQLWGFIAPGLTTNERRGVRFVAPLSVVLFAVGIGVGYGVLPSALRWFISYLPPDAVLIQDPMTYVMFVCKMFLGFGAAFELPIVILFLAKIDLVTPEILWKNWRQATVGISVAAMVLTPSNDAFTMLAMAIPMVMLYFLSIGLVGYVNKKSKPLKK